ncbi:antisig_RsrA, mycothiol system anti-sigma-R factor [Acidimicrobiia bacterium]
MATHDDHDHQQMSNCEQALAEVYTFLDGELTAEKRVLIAGHLDSCNPCFATFDFEAELRLVISTKARSDEVPEALRIRIAERLTIMSAEIEMLNGSDDGTPSAEA